LLPEESGCFLSDENHYLAPDEAGNTEPNPTKNHTAAGKVCRIWEEKHPVDKSGFRQETPFVPGLDFSGGHF